MPMHTWPCQGPQKPSSCATFTPHSHWGRDAKGKKSLTSMRTGSLLSCPTLCDPVDCGLTGSSVRGVSRQEYWTVLANTGCYTLLEHAISCCPSRQLPWEPGAARTPATQAAAPPPHLASQGKPKPSRAASGVNPSGWPTCRGGNTTTIETQGQCG